ncbi:Imm63 family immunity protein, partial [Streptomyces sp. NRRL WC-3742]|uniref:Imm63 family immunity protein n=1 Tax=Streptomyces sp. NRRL WC-3742 TaxID=1463934 RepID=UPI0004CAA4D4
MSTDERSPLQASLEAEITRLSALIRLTPYQTPNFTFLEGATPAMFVDPDGTLHQRYFERGELVSERSTRDPDELLYWAFEAATAHAAHFWATNHPEEPGDYPTRKLARQLSLLHALHPHWAARLRTEHHIPLPD